MAKRILDLVPGEFIHGDHCVYLVVAKERLPDNGQYDALLTLETSSGRRRTVPADTLVRVKTASVLDWMAEI